MNPEHWGPYAWRFLHCVTLTYPETPTSKEMREYKAFFRSLCFVLPCKICRRHYEGHLQQDPLTDKVLSDKTSLVKWLIRIHNRVNKQEHKPVLTYEQALKIIKKC
jgi:hypothetical protein